MTQESQSDESYYIPDMQKERIFGLQEMLEPYISTGLLEKSCDFISIDV